MNKLITTIACLICCIVYTQAQNKNNMLSKKEQSIAAISMYAARGNQDSLKVILARGLDCGLTVSEEKEVLTQLYAYCGFPRSMGALVTLMNLTKERAAQGIKDEAGREPSPVKSSDMFVVGGQNQLKLFGRPALGEVLTFAPALDQFLKAHLFGDIFSRDNLDWRTRELSTVAALSVLDGVKNELNTHIAHAKHNGVTQAQIDEVLIMAARCRNGMVLSESDEPAKTFQTDPTITVRKVFYKNRYDIMLCAEMYLPKDFNEAQHYAALIIGHPFGAVKEQCSGLYAQEMARRGYVTLAFDASYQGESGGEPRHTVSPDALVEDFSASVDWLGLQPFIDRNRIGVIGICGSGGFSVCAASLDPRIKALATVSMYDMGRATRNGLGDSMTDEQRRKLLDEVAEQRWKEAETGEARIRFGTPEKLLGNANAVQKEFFEILHWGMCEVNVDTIRRAHKICPVTAIQSEYHLMHRMVETNGVLELCEDLGIGFVPYSPLNRGFLGGMINEYTKFDVTNDNRQTLPRFQPEAIRANYRIVEVLNAFGRTRGITPAQIALAWLMNKKPFIVPIPGTTKLSHLEENLRACDIRFTAEEIEELETAVAAIPVVGSRYDALQESKIPK